MFSHELRLYHVMLGYAEQLLQDVADDQFVQQPVPGMNHPAWILGHLTFAAQFGVHSCSQPGWLPEDWSARFGIGSEPLSERGRYPSKLDLWADYQQAHQRLHEVVESTPSGRFEAAVEQEGLRDRFPTIGLLIAHLLTTHEATHLGQLSAWRRGMQLPAIGI